MLIRQDDCLLLMVVNDIHCKEIGNGFIDSCYPFIGITSAQWEDSPSYDLKKGIWDIEIEEVDDNYTCFVVPKLNKTFVLTNINRLIQQGYVRVLVEQREEDLCA